MDYQNFALGVIAFSAVLGLVIASPPDIDFSGFDNPLNQQGEKPVTGETHEHALFYVVVNGSELNLTSKRFQLNSRDVHLENGRSHIVHKHRENVTWGEFLDSLKMELERENRTCLTIYSETVCGNGTAVLNGESFNSSAEIEQGDRFAIIIGNGSAEEYMDKKLPRAYIPGIRGRSV